MFCEVGSKPWPDRPRRLAGTPVLALALAGLVLGGCSMFGRGGDEPQTTATTTASASAEKPADGQIDVRRYIGPNYCPELRVLNGAELLRTYESGHEDDSGYVVWQASLGRTARECLYELDGSLTLKVGISGRVISGPKGGPTTVSVPLRVAVVKYKEAVLASEPSRIDVAIPAAGSAVFSEVHNIRVPGPGQERDYIVYVGFDDREWDAMNGELAPKKVVVVKPKKKVLPPKPLPAQPTTPKVLPTPSGGFVLPR